MKLYEFEGYSILKKGGVESPFFITCSDLSEISQARKRLKFPIVVKVQVLSGKRGKAGAIKVCTTEAALNTFAKQFLDKDFQGEQVRFIILAEKIEIDHEYYISITYDTEKKIPFLLFCEEGGVDIEEVKAKDPQKILRVDINPLFGPSQKDLAKIFPKEPNFCDFALRLWDVFWKYDLRLCEVNPLARSSGKLIAVDAKVILDDSGLVRHKNIEVFQKGAISAIPTQRELAAKKIDAEDYRGSAGSTFIEFEGDIAILASGGGASLLVMDALLAFGAKPANYTEYSGNPPREKVEKLAEITLGREGLSGCLVAGAYANFTDIFETLGGFADGLLKIKPKPAYPIVIRRGGPRQVDAYEMLEKIAKKEGFDFHLFGPETPISTACKRMAELSGKYVKTHFRQIEKKKLNIKD